MYDVPKVHVYRKTYSKKYWYDVNNKENTILEIIKSIFRIKLGSIPYGISINPEDDLMTKKHQTKVSHQRRMDLQLFEPIIHLRQQGV